MLGINGGELVVIILVALIVVGPERLPQYAAQLRQLVVRARDLLRETKEAVKSEAGDDVDWSALDPRQYDPRRIVADALRDDPRPAAGKAAASAAAAVAPSVLDEGAAAPFDADAT